MSESFQRSFTFAILSAGCLISGAISSTSTNGRAEFGWLIFPGIILGILAILETIPINLKTKKTDKE